MCCLCLEWDLICLILNTATLFLNIMSEALTLSVLETSCDAHMHGPLKKKKEKRGRGVPFSHF